MKRTLALCFVVVGVVGCGKSGGPGGPPKPGSPDAGRSLADARKGFQTKLENRGGPREAPDPPPENRFRLVTYPAGPGPLAAYLTPETGGGRKPAIVWITGGDCNSIGDVWSPADPNNVQTASQYRQAGVVMMFPS